jgi:ribonuclease J
VVREREALARDGFILINLTLNRRTMKMSEEPEIITRGFIYPRNGEDLMAAASKLITETARSGNANVEQDLEQAIKTFIFNKTRRRPMVFVSLSRV